MHSIETLKAIVGSGAGIKVDAKAIALNSLTELVAAANSGAGKVVITNANHLLKGTVESLAAIGGASVDFEL